MRNNSLQVFAGGWAQLQHAKHVNSDVIPGILDFLTGIMWEPQEGKTFIAIDAATVDQLRQYDVPTAHITTGATLVASFTINPPEGNPRGMDIHPNGKTIWFMGTGDDRIHEVNMTARWDLSTASLGAQSPILPIPATQGLTVVDLGRKVFIVDSTDKLMEFNLSTPYDITTISSEILPNFDLLPNSENPRDIRFHASGSMFFTASTFGNVARYTMTTPFDKSTATFADLLDTTLDITNVQGFTIRPTDGKRLYVIDSSDDSIHTYEMSLAENNTLIDELGNELVDELGNPLV